MKYVIIGSLGNISKPLAKQLTDADHEVFVISSTAERSEEIQSLGASPLIGSVDDVKFLKHAFAEADAVYTMVPPNFGAENWKQYIADIGKNFAEALRESSVKHVVNLSSVGAHMADGCGPVSGLYYVENDLNALEGIHVLHLRAGYFYNNFYGMIPMIQGLGFIGNNFGTKERIALVDTDDIADIAAQALLQRSFTGKSIQYVSSDVKSVDEIATTLGTAIDIPDLKWVDLSDEQVHNGMTQAGLSKEIADNFLELGAALRNGLMLSHYFETNQRVNGHRSLEAFAQQFARAFQHA